MTEDESYANPARQPDTPARGWRRLLPLLTVALLVGVIAPRSAPARSATGAYALVQDVTTATFSRMVDLATIPGAPDEAVVVSQKDALVRRVSLSGAFAPALLADLSDRVKRGGSEEGLLSIAFSPEFTADGRVYLYYTSKFCAPGVDRCSHLSRFAVVDNEMVEESEVVVLEIDQRLSSDRHNGGRLLFGPDGYLYLSVGDGGGSGDPLETGQDNTDLLGSLLRIDVTGQERYAVPPGNPFNGKSGADEVWAYGFRNPWRYSFDSLTGNLWVGDVGQSGSEEVEPVIAGGNYGWDCLEGFSTYEGEGCGAGSFLSPRAAYDHRGFSCAVTGGYVYRGEQLPDLYGWYIYADFCSGKVWAVDTTDNGDPVAIIHSQYSISSFAELPNHELLLLTFNSAIYRLTCRAELNRPQGSAARACNGDAGATASPTP